MKKILLFVVSCMLMLQAFTQEPPARRMKTFKVVVFHADRKMHTGYLASLSDSVLNLVSKAALVNDPAPGQVYTSFHYAGLDKIILKRKGSVAKGALIGAFAGGSIGVITGFMSGDDPPCAPSDQDFFGLGYALCEGFRTTASEKAAAGGTVGVLGGAIIGVCVGAILHKKFIIARRKDSYKKMQLTVLERLYVGKN